MKKLRIIILITGILVAGLAFSASAQKGSEKSSAYRAIYGDAPGKPKHKLQKKQKARKYSRNKPAKGTKHTDMIGPGPRRRALPW